MTKRQPRRTNQSGSFELIGMLIACAVLLIMAAVAAPSIVKLAQTNNENSAAGQLAQLGAAEFSMSQINGVFVAPLNLLGNLALPISCTNPMLASGAQVQAPTGYNSIFTPGPSLSPPSGCAGVQGYSAYSISLTPINSLEAQRRFFMTSVDGGVIHFTDQNHLATISDPVMSISVPVQGSVSTILVVQNTTGNGGGSTGNGPVYSGDTPSTDINPNVGTGQYFVPAGFNGETVTPVEGSFPTSAPSTSGQVHTFSVSLNPPVSSNPAASLSAVLIDVTLNSNPTQVQCTCNGAIYVGIASGQASGMGAPASGGMVLDPTHNYTVRFTANGDQDYSGVITWTIQ